MKLFLIDGHALIFKMYYAFLGRPMVNSKGVDTSILFGFTKYLLELIDRERPTHIAVSFDPPGGTFRNELYPEYKANRGETPALVVEALEPLTRIVEALDIPVLMLPGYEADDVIGSAAKRFEGEGFEVYMVTPDKDYGQLITPHILQVKPGKGGGENELLGVAEVCDKWKISSPAQVIDILAICGDASDNVPGVAGVGPVGAAKLLGKYGSVEGIYAHLDELTVRQQEQFRAAEGHIALSKRLVTIKTDIPLDVTAGQLVYDTVETPELSALLDLYEMPSLKRLLKKVALPAGAVAAVAGNGARAHASDSDLRAIPLEGAQGVKADSPAKQVRVATVFGGSSLPDNESSALQNRQQPPATVAARGLVNGGTASEAQRWDEREARSCPVAGCLSAKKVVVNLVGEKLFVGCEAGVAEGGVEEFRKILEDATVTKVGVDLKGQMKALAEKGIALAGRLEDIELMHYLLGPERSHKLDVLARSYLGIELDAAAPEETGSLFDDVPDESGPDRILETAAILRLSDCLLREMAATEGMTRLYDEIEEPLIGVLARMERIGVKVDLSSLRDFADGLRRKMTEREAEVRRLADDPALNILSPKQIGVVLFEKLKLDPKARKPKSGNWPTDEQTLSHLADRSPIIDAILDYRGLRKLLSTYIEPFAGYISPADGRVHTTFNQALTATGRLSSSNPNLQNIPIRTEEGREIRKAFVPGEPGWVMMSADYSQIELRLMAHLCGDAHMVDAFRSGLDVHAATAAKIFRIPLADVTPDQRRIAKTANFGIMYGISSFGLAERLRCSRTEAKQIIDDYFASFPSIRGFIDATVAQARERGYVETLFGRRRYIADIAAGNAAVRALAERNAVNAPIQGTAADIIKLAMTAVDRRLREGGFRSRMVLQIHDELLLEVPQEEIAPVRELLVREMEGVISLSVPLTVECNDGKTWLEAH
ncbi:MAG: DNA polymerase I [Bacteroidales bacterium]|nr:DNA polymerase I [Bacteroidales bacterium]